LNYNNIISTETSDRSLRAFQAKITPQDDPESFVLFCWKKLKLRAISKLFLETMMKIPFGLITVCLMSVLPVPAYGQGVTVASQTNLLAQAQTQVDYGAHLRDGLERENRRHSREMVKLQQERNNANRDFQIQANQCSNGSLPANYRKCIEEARNTLRAELSAIKDREITANTLYKNNMISIRDYWQGQMNYPCNRPDCINNTPGQRPVCSGGSCR
jgi:hypothetical protein